MTAFKSGPNDMSNTCDENAQSGSSDSEVVMISTFKYISNMNN